MMISLPTVFLKLFSQHFEVVQHPKCSVHNVTLNAFPEKEKQTKIATTFFI